MSKLFSDPVYEDMCESEDAWLELAVEPYVFRANDVLRVFPDEYEFSYDELADFVQRFSRVNVRIDEPILMPYVLSKCCDNDEMNEQTAILLNKYTRLQVDEGTQLDMVNKELTGCVKLIKTQECVHEQDIPVEVAELAYRKLMTHTVDKSYPDTVRRLSEIQDILDSEDHRSSRSARTKLDVIRRRFRTILSQDLWRIRDADLAMEVADWIVQYGIHGKIYALTNLSRLKCMTHSESPIYSMEKHV